MKNKFEFVWFRREFIPTANGDGGQELAAWFLDDIQTYIPTIDRWKRRVSDVASGRYREGYNGTGNAHSVFFINNMAFIRCEFDEGLKVLISYDQLLLLLDNYKHFLASGYSDQNTIPPPIEFEYIAEGQEAFDRYLETGGSLGLSDDEMVYDE